MNKAQKKIFVVIAILLFVASLFFPCYSVEGKGPNTIGAIGLIAFFLGWLNFNLIGIVWLANPLFFFSIIFLFKKKKERLALFLSVLSLVFCLCFFFVDRIIINEGGMTAEIDQFLNGYWLWLTAIFLIFICSLIMNISKREK